MIDGDVDYPERKQIYGTIEFLPMLAERKLLRGRQPSESAALTCRLLSIAFYPENSSSLVEENSRSIRYTAGCAMLARRIANRYKATWNLCAVQFAFEAGHRFDMSGLSGIDSWLWLEKLEFYPWEESKSRISAPVAQRVEFDAR